VGQPGAHREGVAAHRQLEGERGGEVDLRRLVIAEGGSQRAQVAVDCALARRARRHDEQLPAAGGEEGLEVGRPLPVVEQDGALGGEGQGHRPDPGPGHVGEAGGGQPVELGGRLLRAARLEVGHRQEGPPRRDVRVLLDVRGEPAEELLGPPLRPPGGVELRGVAQREVGGVAREVEHLGGQAFRLLEAAGHQRP
jgi:hypothetical protein